MPAKTMTEDAPPEGRVPDKFPFAIGEHVTGQGITGEVVERPGHYSVTVQPRTGPRISFSVTRVGQVKP